MAARFFYGWWVVLASAVGLALHYGPVISLTFGIFLKPVAAEFGWSRTQISAAFSLSVIVLTLLQPLTGRWVDRYGARRIIVSSTVLFGLTVMGFCLQTGVLWHYYALWLLLGFVGTGSTPVPYSKVITQWFDRRRGLALAIAVSGSSIGTIVIPPLTQAIIDGRGWRGAYLALGLLVVFVAVPTVSLLMRNTPASMGLRVDGEETLADRVINRDDENTGLSINAARRHRALWIMIIAFFGMSVSFHACILHFVPLLTDRGISPADAAGMTSILAVGILIGRLVTGLLLDRYFAPHVAMGFFSALGAGLVILWSGAGGAWLIAAAILIGLAQGAELDLMAYMVSRYFGLRAFAEIYSYAFSGFMLGAVVGPPLMAATFDATGSYQGALAGFFLAPIIAIICMTRLGPYRLWEHQSDPT